MIGTKEAKALEIKEWEEKLTALNDKINALKTWDDYAERLQARYDEMLNEDPRQTK